MKLLARLNTVTTRNVLREFVSMLNGFGLPNVLGTDNGPQIASAEFAMFMRQKGITNLTYCPHYAQSNGNVYNAVKTMQLLCAKVKQVVSQNA